MENKTGEYSVERENKERSRGGAGGRRRRRRRMEQEVGGEIREAAEAREEWEDNGVSGHELNVHPHD
jgi:hypothetical protein